MRIEQAKICMPEIKVYYYPEESDTEEFSASLNDKKLTVAENYPYAEDEQGADFYIMVDISKSISKEYFEDIKNAILGFQAGMQEKDTLTVITFGNQVSVLVEKKRKSDDFQSLINGLVNVDDNTHLFEALDTMTKMADQKETICQRTVAVVITDGEDCSQNENTRSQSIQKLQEAGIPVYGLVVKETASGASNIFIEDISDFIYETQGKIYQFGEGEAVSVTQQLMTDLNSARVLKLQNDTNKITSVMQPLTIMSDKTGSKSIEVCPHFYKEDKNAPHVDTTLNSETSIKIAFDEAVLNADQISSYKVTRGNQDIPIYTVEYNNEAHETILSFAENLKDGKYTVNYQGIIDTSMEENAVTDSSVFTVKGGESVRNTGIISTGIIIVAGIIGILAVAFVLAVFIKKRKKDMGREMPSDILNTELCFEIHGDEESFEMKTAIIDRVIVGRSSSCDIVIPDKDKLLSRQHFVIEKDGGSFYVSDQETANGTKVNGIEINSRYKLKNGDVVQAGNYYITITW